MGRAGFDGWVGVFDSGVGGISVLRSLVKTLPREDFVFFGDSANAPYGNKPADQVMAYSRSIVTKMIDDGAKAIVIACNTATSVAAERLRVDYPGMPIVGMEPAIRPAVLALRGKRILVMATENTLRLEKFKLLESHFSNHVDIVSVPCPGLADRIEQGNLGAPDVKQLIEQLVGRYRGQVDGVVLGCTHYPFVEDRIREVVGDIPFFDGNMGTAKQLGRSLMVRGLVAAQEHVGSVTFTSSIDTPDELALYRRFYELPMEMDAVTQSDLPLDR